MVTIVVLYFMDDHSGVPASIQLSINISLFLCIFGIWAILSLPRIGAKKSIDKHCNINTVTYSIDQEGIKYKTDQYSSFIKWPDIQQIKESKEYIFLFFDGIKPITLFKSNLADSVLHEILEVLKDAPVEDKQLISHHA